ncbi:hypothetical protein J2Y69_003545 [Microbacterium resistens]|uniref:LytR/CpsA/Psr regulator C-terminal domain-containing protein n=1 Tax=Microbacterium resistens TaxID=156977 RepID=A0ABU1SH20_9MICO|nr:LytR C-terminal domain-containing protein [Microbacterium resistens]MDR6868919.1 hypothetical protein [Microbacterium resistens]
MPTPVRDRFDDVPRTEGRVGAHRAESPGMNGWVVLLWSVVAALILAAGGIFGAMVSMGQISFGPEPSMSAPTPTPTVTGVLDPSYGVLVLNATSGEGLATGMRETLIGAGWPASSVLAGDADAQDFPETTVFYLTEADKPAALGLADRIGGAKVQLSDVYHDDFGEGAKQLTIVIGLDRLPQQPAPVESPAGETPGTGSDGSSTQ